MSYKSSINQQKKSLTIQENHNDRSISPNYLICKRDIEVNHSAKNALKKRNEIISNAISNYQKNCNSKNKKFQAKSYEWSAVCNIKPDTTMEQLKKIADYYEQNLGFQCYQIAIHRDEGHLVSLKDKNITLNAGKDFFLDQKTGIYYKGSVIEKQSKKGEKVLKYVKTNEILAQNIDELKKEYEISINHHAHLEFISLDKETGKNRSRDLFNDKQKMRELQSKVAEILEMERGADKRISGAERIKPRAYGAMKQREKAERKALNNELNRQKSLNKELNEVFDELDKELELPYQKTIADSAKSYISKIQQIKQKNAELEQQYNQKLKAELEKIKKENDENLKKIKKDYDADRDKLKQSGEATQQNYINLKEEFEKEKKSIQAKYEQEIEKIEAQHTKDYNALVDEYNDLVKLIKQERELREKAESKNAQNRDFADTSSAAPVKEETETERKMRLIDEALAKPNSAPRVSELQEQDETNLEIARNDFNDNNNTKPFKNH